MWNDIAAAISEAVGARFEPATVSEIGGGCINRAARLADDRRSYFVKINDRASLPMFEAERDGLDEIGAPAVLRVPRPVTSGVAGGMAYLVLEFIPMSRVSGEGWVLLGERLAALHRTSASAFGWHRDNTIGSTPQVNDWTADWLAFWRTNRLGFQLDLAVENGLNDSTIRAGRRLMERLEGLFVGYEPLPSLLHGDLWGGNVAACDGGEPVLFDPAVYYGDREADIAMSELFGRFDPGFYEAYRNAWPLDSGHAERKTLYNLYHVLNHFNLFGGGYGGQAGAMIDRLLKVL